MSLPNYYQLPFFNDDHRELASQVDAWAAEHLHEQNCTTREIVSKLGQAGWLRHVVGKPSVTHLAMIRETLAYYSGLADCAFAMQGLGSYPVSAFAMPEIRETYLPKVAAGEVYCGICHFRKTKRVLTLPIYKRLLKKTATILC